MRSSFFKIIIVLLFILFRNELYAQNSKIEAYKDTLTINKLSDKALINIEGFIIPNIVDTTDAYYNLELFSTFFNYFNGDFNMRLEEEPSYGNGVDLFKEFVYFDICWNYNLGALDFSLVLNNLLSFNNSEFSIEPELYSFNDVIKEVYFIHDQNFSIQASIAYTF